MSNSLRVTLVVAFAMLLVGILLHFFALLLRDHGPSFGNIAFTGNGALIVFVLDLIAIIVAEVICVKRRAWPGTILLLLTWFTGRFLIFGSI